jgi:hypothetical protein
LDASPDVIGVIKSRRMRWAWHVAHMGEMRNAYSIFVCKSEGKRPLGSPGSKWEDIRMDLIGFIWLRIGTSGGIL